MTCFDETWSEEDVRRDAAQARRVERRRAWAARRAEKGQKRHGAPLRPIGIRIDMSEIIGRSIYSGLAAWLPGASEEAGPAFFGTAPSEREVDLYRREWLGEWMRDAAVFGTAAARVTDGRIERVDPSTIPHVESEAEVSQHPTDQTEESADGEE